MEYFRRARGYIAYRRCMGQTLVLSDPVCAPDSREALIAEFLRAHPRPLFMQVSGDTTRVMQRHGFYATPVGVENEIDTFSFGLAGKRKRDLRHYRNRAMAAGVVVREERDSAALRRELKPVSDAWLRLKKSGGHELAFLARPFVLEEERGVRIFTGRCDGAPVAFVVLDPMYRAGEVRGYTVTILRHRRDAPEGAVDFINLHVIEQLRREGIALLSLGISPFDRIAEIAREAGHGLPTVYLGFCLMRHFGDSLYHFRGLSFHKSRYRATQTPSFACLKGPVGFFPLVASARACRMI
jgi:lysylphosphatidylglycerol synthetase-like protein (DUF2156 family)